MTYAIYQEVPHYNDYDAIDRVSFRFTGHRYITKALALKMASRFACKDQFSEDVYRVVLDGDRWFQPVHEAAVSTMPLMDEDIPF